MRRIVELWRGEVPLAQTFWLWAILGGLLVNSVATIATFTVLANDAPGLLAVALYFTPIPYDVLMVVAVWRSAARHDGRPEHANWARVAVLAWAVAMLAL